MHLPGLKKKMKTTNQYRLFWAKKTGRAGLFVDYRFYLLGLARK